MLKIQLLSTGEFLSIPTSEVMTVELFSSLMNGDDDLLGSYSYQFNLDDNEHNRRVLGNANLVTSSHALRTAMVRVWLGNYPWKDMQMQICRTSGLFEAQMLIDNGLIANELKNINLNAIFGNSSGYGDTYDDSRVFYSYDDYQAFMKATTTAAPETYPMVFFPFKNDAFVAAVAAADYAKYPDYLFPLSLYVNEWDGPTQNFVIDTGNPIQRLESPAYWLTYVVKRVIKWLGYTPQGNWFTDPDVQRLVIQSAVGINSAASSITIADMPNFMPAIALNDFFKEIRNRFGLVIAFSDISKTCLLDSLDLLLDNKAYVDLRPYQQATPDDFVPDDTGFTITLAKDDNDTVQASTDAAVVAQQQPLILGDGSSSTDLIDTPTVMLVEDTPYNNIETISIAGNVETVTITTPSAVPWRIPHVGLQMHTSDKFVLIDQISFADKGKFTLRLLYYHGMQPDQKRQLYPYAAFDNLDYNGVAINNYSLSLVAGSAAALTIRNFYNFRLNARKLQVNYVMPQSAFIQVANNLRVLFRDENNAMVSCVLDQLTADLGYDEWVTAQAVLYSRPMENNATGIVISTDNTVTPPPDNGTVYAKMLILNQTPQSGSQAGGQIEYSGVKGDIYVYFYADAAATTPKNVTGLNLTYHQHQVGDAEDTGDYDATAVASGTQYLLYQSAWLNYSEQDLVNGQMQTTTNYTNTFSLVDIGTYYIIN